jgi:large subunit ribosomal protein L6
MSRVGKKPIVIESGVKVKVEANTVFVEGPKGKLQMSFEPRFSVQVKGDKITVKRPTETKEDFALHGLIRSNIFNMVKGVKEGYKKELEIRGVGYKAEVKGKELVLLLGFSHPVKYPIPENISIKTPKPVQITVEGPDKIKVGEVASEIRAYYEPEPYKGKGIRYVGEYVRHKAGKTVA